ncbi:MAG: P-loop NTPase, partial [Solirubrobacterales bacterium]
FSIFGEGGGQLLADDIGVPLLGQIPLSEELRIHADEGNPLVIDQPESPAGKAIIDMAKRIISMSPRELPMLQTEMQSATPPAETKLGAKARELPVLQ